MRHKLSGHFPQAAWSEVGRLLLPRALAPQPVDVVELRRGEDPCPVLWGTALGPFWGRESDAAPLGIVVTEQLRGDYQRGPVSIGPGDVVLDVGGHLGGFTRVALDHGAGKVVVFEPNAVNIECFSRTFARELAAGKVALVEAAAWEAKGVLEFGGEGGSFHAAWRGEKTGLVAVPARTIDDVVEELGLGRVDFVKMDIEGSERHALRGAARVIGRFRPNLALCQYHFVDDPVVIRRIIREQHPSYREYVPAYYTGQIYLY